VTFQNDVSGLTLTLWTLEQGIPTLHTGRSLILVTPGLYLSNIGILEPLYSACS